MVLDRINQSMIKDIGHDQSCPMRFRLYYLDKTYKNAATKAMVKGQYFEMLTLGSIAQDGSIPEIPLLKNGSKSSEHKRIDQQVENFKKKIEEEGIVIVETDIKLEGQITLFDGRVVTLYGTIDSI